MGFMRMHQNRVRNEGRVIAEMPKKKAVMGIVAGGQLAALITASLQEDLAILSAASSIVRKVEIKRETLIPKYAEYVVKLKDAGSMHDLLGYYLVWLFDAGMIGEALDHAAWCMGKGLKLPEKFRSELPYFVALQLIEWAEGEQKQKRAVDPYFAMVFAEALADPQAWNLPDDLTARFYRLSGLVALEAEAFDKAEADLAIALDMGAKVSTKLEEARKKIKRAQQEGETDPAGGSGDDSPAAAPAGDAFPNDAVGDDSPATPEGSAVTE